MMVSRGAKSRTGNCPRRGIRKPSSSQRTESATSLRFTALTGYGADASAALAEIAVLYAGPKLAENSDGAVDYKRVRSTSSDVDEGPVTAPTTKPKP